ncbi:MAG: hypothetical protein EZS28_023276 [Streblomastix strix]|uniref:Tyr recombinase domain-containing protein n=1 Tax=Streblomastix strix TaxID=222440 RepID=A0A5J4VF57_9EUKA|nr:MAG: hypothetical protein EZS28_023276 [Streblomastix strix]
MVQEMEKQTTPSVDYCSKQAKQIIVAAGEKRKFRITELGSATITKAIDSGIPTQAINTWSVHSEAIKILQRYHYSANSDQIIDAVLGPKQNLNSDATYVEKPKLKRCITKVSMKKK